MYITSKRFTKSGTTRFGSSIFIDDREEDLVDSIKGIQRDQSILIALFFLSWAKILSANILGLFITLPLFTVMYFKAVKLTKVSYTEHRLLVETEFLNPRIVIGLGNFLIGVSVFLGLRQIFPELLNPDIFRLEGMALVFQFFGLYDNRFFIYRNFYSANSIFLISFDTILTLLISLWYAYQFKQIKYEFKEISLKHVSEQLIRRRSINTLFSLSVFIIFVLFIEFSLFEQFSLVTFLILLLVYRYAPRKSVLILSVIGPSNGVLLRNCILDYNQVANLSRTTATTFGWLPQLNQSSRKFPHNIIPDEVASVFETGLQSYSSTAYRQANILGAGISSLTNLVVILALIRFIIVNDLDAWDRLLLIVLVLIGISLLVGLAIELVNYIRLYVRSGERLFIGEGFVGRYLTNSLWILNSRSLEGTTVQRGANNPLIRYDKAKGMTVEWERFTLLFLVGTVTLLIGIWNYLGAINLRTIPLIFPSLIDLGIEFLEEKAQAELEFFIIGGYVLWVMTILLYPRFYSRNRPSLYLDMQYASIEPIVLRDFKEHQDASVRFTKSLVHAAKQKQRNLQVRPGLFLLQISLTGQIGLGSYLLTYAGDNHQLAEVNLPIVGEQVLYRSIPVSGLKGYPEIQLIVELYNEKNESIHAKSLDIAILYGKESIREVDFGSFGSIKIKTTIKRQKS